MSVWRAWQQLPSCLTGRSPRTQSQGVENEWVLRALLETLEPPQPKARVCHPGTFQYQEPMKAPFSSVEGVLKITQTQAAAAEPGTRRMLQVTHSHPRGPATCPRDKPIMCLDTLSFHQSHLQKALRKMPGNTAQPEAHDLFTPTLSVRIPWPLCHGLVPAFASSVASCCMFNILVIEVVLKNCATI